MSEQIFIFNIIKFSKFAFWKKLEDCILFGSWQALDSQFTLKKRNTFLVTRKLSQIFMVEETVFLEFIT